MNSYKLDKSGTFNYGTSDSLLQNKMMLLALNYFGAGFTENAIFSNTPIEGISLSLLDFKNAGINASINMGVQGGAPATCTNLNNFYNNIINNPNTVKLVQYLSDDKTNTGIITNQGLISSHIDKLGTYMTRVLNAYTNSDSDAAEKLTIRNMLLNYPDHDNEAFKAASAHVKLKSFLGTTDGKHMVVTYDTDGSSNFGKDSIRSIGLHPTVSSTLTKHTKTVQDLSSNPANKYITYNPTDGSASIIPTVDKTFNIGAASQEATKSSLLYNYIIKNDGASATVATEVSDLINQGIGIGASIGKIPVTGLTASLQGYIVEDNVNTVSLTTPLTNPTAPTTEDPTYSYQKTSSGLIGNQVVTTASTYKFTNDAYKNILTGESVNSQLSTTFAGILTVSCDNDGTSAAPTKCFVSSTANATENDKIAANTNLYTKLPNALIQLQDSVTGQSCFSDDILTSTTCNVVVESSTGQQLRSLQTSAQGLVSLDKLQFSSDGNTVDLSKTIQVKVASSDGLQSYLSTAADKSLVQLLSSNDISCNGISDTCNKVGNSLKGTQILKLADDVDGLVVNDKVLAYKDATKSGVSLDPSVTAQMAQATSAQSLISSTDAPISQDPNDNKKFIPSDFHTSSVAKARNADALTTGDKAFLSVDPNNSNAYTLSSYAQSLPTNIATLTGYLNDFATKDSVLGVSALTYTLNPETNTGTYAISTDYKALATTGKVFGDAVTGASDIIVYDTTANTISLTTLKQLLVDKGNAVDNASSFIKYDATVTPALSLQPLVQSQVDMGTTFSAAVTDCTQKADEKALAACQALCSNEAIYSTYEAGSACKKQCEDTIPVKDCRDGILKNIVTYNDISKVISLSKNAAQVKAFHNVDKVFNSNLINGDNIGLTDIGIMMYKLCVKDNVGATNLSTICGPTYMSGPSSATSMNPYIGKYHTAEQMGIHCQLYDVNSTTITECNTFCLDPIDGYMVLSADTDCNPFN